MTVQVFIQARTDSKRLPGKIMLPMDGVPLLIGLWERLKRPVVLMPDSDPAINLLPKKMVRFIVTGPLDVASRFRRALDELSGDLDSHFGPCNPCEGFVRVCADSPFLTYDLVELAMTACTQRPYTLISAGRAGLQCEGFRARDFLEAEKHMVGEEREHLGFYFRKKTSLAIDTQEDYDRLKDMPCG